MATILPLSWFHGSMVPWFVIIGCGYGASPAGVDAGAGGLGVGAVQGGGNRKGLALGLGGEDKKLLEHDLASLASELVDVGGGEAGGGDGVEDCEGNVSNGRRCVGNAECGVLLLMGMVPDLKTMFLRYRMWL